MKFGTRIYEIILLNRKESIIIEGSIFNIHRAVNEVQNKIS